MYENLVDLFLVLRKAFVRAPWCSNSNRLRFTHLPQKCIIKIYTISGEFVDEIIHNDTIDGNEYWDLKNSSGKKVAPGLYIYIVQTDNGKTLTGKFAIIR